MKRIRVVSQQSTGLNPLLSGASVIEMEDAVLGEGGFGVAYRAVSFDGRQVTPQVIKLLTSSDKSVVQRGFSTVQELQKRLSVKNAALVRSGTSLMTRFPALEGVPQLSFEGELDGDRVLGYSANDLTAAGFEDLSNILNDTAKLQQFDNAPLLHKITMAWQLATAFLLLSSELSFIHADIKAEAIFVDLNKTRCAMIDYDGGAVMRSPSDRPLTYGAAQEWLAPEIIQQLSPSNASRIIKVDLFSDAWSVNFAIHYLLTALPPFTFFTEISERSMKAYAQRFKWPHVDRSFPYFDQQQSTLYAAHVQRLNRLPAEILRQFEFTFTQGFLNPNRRTSYSQWETVLHATSRPVIHFFRADRDFVKDTRPVTLAWSTGGAAHCQINGIGNVPGKGSLDVQIRQDTVFELVLTSFSDPRLTRTIHVQVSKEPPIIHSFASSSMLLTDDTPAKLTWHISGSEQLHIDHGIGDVTGLTAVEVRPRQETSYILTATSPFGISVQAKLLLRVSTVPPTIGYFKSDRALLKDRTPVMLSWSVSNDAHEVTISGIGSVSRNGTLALQQRRDASYVLTATSYFGYASTRSLPVLVSKDPPVIDLLKVSPAFVREGMSAVVRWKVSGAEEVLLEPEIGFAAVEGQTTICVPSSGIVRLIAKSYFGVVACKEVSVTVLRKTILTTKRTELTHNRTSLTVRERI